MPEPDVPLVLPPEVCQEPVLPPIQPQTNPPSPAPDASLHIPLAMLLWHERVAPEYSRVAHGRMLDLDGAGAPGQSWTKLPRDSWAHASSMWRERKKSEDLPDRVESPAAGM